MGVGEEKGMKRLWGDSFFNASKWVGTDVQQSGSCTVSLQRAFCHSSWVAAPLVRAIMNVGTASYGMM
eukprot:11137486-Lingulodinium_polyedra.AAC.1